MTGLPDEGKVERLMVNGLFCGRIVFKARWLAFSSIKPQILVDIQFSLTHSMRCVGGECVYGLRTKTYSIPGDPCYKLEPDYAIVNRIKGCVRIDSSLLPCTQSTFTDRKFRSPLGFRDTRQRSVNRDIATGPTMSNYAFIPRYNRGDRLSDDDAESKD
jgi:hypothetical protein